MILTVYCSSSYLQYHWRAKSSFTQTLSVCNFSFDKNFDIQFSMEYWTVLLSIAISILSAYYLLREFNFFKRNGIIHLPPIPILGSSSIFTIFRWTSFSNFTENLYNFIPDAKYFGFYAATQPVFLLRDPELIKDMFVKNFEVFPNRRAFGDIDDPLFDKSLFSLQGQRWKDMRCLLSPAFTSSKMKIMFSLISECAIDFTEFLSSNKGDTDMKDIFSKYTNDVIVTCAYGIKVDSIKDPKNKFYIYGTDAVDFTGIRLLKFLFFRSFPWLARSLGVTFSSNQVLNFFKHTIKNTIETRDAENITRPDMIQLMMDIRGKRGTERELSIDDMTAQAFIFYFGGLDTSSTTMSFAAYEIATHLDIQTKLKQEIDEVLETTDGEVTYEAIHKLKYLDAVINEVLRHYPPVMLIDRVCEKAYELPPALPGEKPFILKKDMVVWAPIYAIQHDEKYYDNPEKFCPERFLDNDMYHNSSCYMPFGCGPRMCIANRFAMLEIKIILFHLLARCELKPCAKTTLPMRFNKRSLLMLPENGLWLNIQRRNDMHPAVGSMILHSDTTQS